MKTKILILFLISIFTLSACGKTENIPAEEVIQKFKENVELIDTVVLSASLKVSGKDAEENLDFNLTVDAKVDRRDESEQKADIELELSGSFKAGDQLLDGNVSLRIITLGDGFYFNLDEVETNDPKYDSIKPLVEIYQKKWLQIPDDFIPEEVKKLQQKDAEALEVEKKLKDLFVDTKLFEITKEYGVKTLNGKKVHHYGVKFNKDGVKQYLRKAAAISGEEPTDVEMKEVIAFVDGFTNIEIWIGADDYFLYKGIAEISNDDLSQGVEADISLSYVAKSYNTNLKIEVPEDAEEFNPLSILMGMQIPGVPVDGLPEEVDFADLENLDAPE